MTSSDLFSFGFNPWQPIPPEQVSCRNLILRLPRVNGVYLIKANQAIARLTGASDLLYIGHGKVQTRVQSLLIAFLPYRFKNYSTPHSAAKELTRIMRETELELSVTYLTKDSKALARAFESGLLQRYCSDHIEPPPLNNTRK